MNKIPRWVSGVAIFSIGVFVGVFAFMKNQTPVNQGNSVSKEADTKITQGRDEVNSLQASYKSIWEAKKQIVSVSESEPGLLTCDHAKVNNIASYEYENWPVYKAKSFGVSFSYPPKQKPNFEQEFVDEDGQKHLSVGYNPHLDLRVVQDGKESLVDLDDTWQVDIYRNNKEARVDKNYCNTFNDWCVLEEVKDRGIDTYVLSYEEDGMLNPYLREYYMYESGLVVHISSAAGASADQSSPCLAVSSTFNLDYIAKSIRLDK